MVSEEFQKKKKNREGKKIVTQRKNLILDWEQKKKCDDQRQIDKQTNKRTNRQINEQIENEPNFFLFRNDNLEVGKKKSRPKS